MKEPQSARAAASPPPPPDIREQQRELLRRKNPFIGARFNLWRLFVALAFVILILSLLFTIRWAKGQISALSADVAAANAKIAKLAKSPQASSTPAPETGGSTLTAEDARNIDEMVKEQLDPLRSQINEAIKTSDEANDTVQKMLAEPPYVVTGKDAMLFTTKRFLVFDERLTKLENAVFPQPSDYEGAASDLAQPSNTLIDDGR